ncbi:LysR family transcriptional regulator [Orrella sp. 11846]|uniref:LysR family transcriptional regulator n=1 Tax=Orrella sp. 11846 TaxID=3409913 RepID=UPI003B5915DC
MENSLVHHASDLLLFVSLAQAGSFSAAATRTGVPKSTLSRRLAALEEKLGQRLMTRSTRQLVLTDFGQRVLRLATVLQEDMQAVTDLVQREAVRPTGVLRVSLPPDLEQLNLTHVLQQYHKRFPDVRVELDISSRQVDLLSERFDLAVRIARQLPDDSTLVARKLCDIQIHLYAGAKYLKRFGTPLEPQDLEWHACIHHANSLGLPFDWDLKKGAEICKIVAKGPVSSNSPRLQCEMCLQGMGIVALADSMVLPEIESGQLVRVLPEWALPSVPIWCVTPGRKLLPAMTRAFMNALSKALSTDASI